MMETIFGRRLRERWFGLALTLLAAVIAAMPQAAPATTADDTAPGFAAWLEDVRREARALGVSESTLDEALAGLAPVSRVIELDRRQAEFTQTFWNYMDRRVTPERIARGRDLLRQHAALLSEIETRYGVQPRFLVAFWGLESNYGDYTGDFPIVAALATLAYDDRRPALFREQLLTALRIIDQGHVRPADMTGSWAGAMGQVQFLPTTFARHAVDHDGDGRKDIWSSVPDAMASAANYLASLGWRGDQTWGREVRLPADFPLELADLSVTRPLKDWAALGVRRIDGGPLPAADLESSIIIPGGVQGPAFAVYHNYRVILRWNRSILYAVSVGHLADRLIGEPPLQTPRPAEEVPLSRDQVVELQRLLGDLGFDAGTPDGVVGAQTRAALKAFQKQADQPPDGYPTIDLLRDLRAAKQR